MESQFAKDKLKNGVPVDVQDQTTQLVDLYFFREDGTFSLAQPAVIDQAQFTVTDSTGMDIGDIVCFQDGLRSMQASIISVDVNTISIDTPFDYGFSLSAGCTYGTSNMNVDGSVVPQIFRVSPKNLSNGSEWDIVRIIFSITDVTAMDDGMFGGLVGGLANGVLLRVSDGLVKNIFTVRTNGDFALRCYDVSYVPETLGPSGLYGLRAMRTFGGQDKNGVVIRLRADTDDELELIIRDDLTGLNTFQAVVQGHVTDPL